MFATDFPPNGDSRPALRNAAMEAGLLEMGLDQEGQAKASIDGAPEVAGYEIINRLGSGASGEVWLADELETGRIVALKILHRHGITGASEEVLQREIRMLATLVHPNLVLLHRAIVTADGRQGLAMEWIDGWALDEWLELHPDLSLDRKLRLFHGIVRGVAHLHDHGVIHRDLKPANLIVDAEGVAKIVDFGLARLHREGAGSGTYGDSIGVSGTLHFMAPEQAANGEGARAMPVDVYALGLIFHRILTGEWLVPTRRTPAETLALVLDPPPLALQGAARSLPRDLQWILRQALAPNPARRYRHARDLEADLERFSAKLPVTARKHTFVYLTASLLRRQARRSVFAGILVLAGLAAGGAIYQRHRQVAARNEANLRYAYNLTSFTLGQLRDELRTMVPGEESQPQVFGRNLPGAGDAGAPALPVNAAGELDLRYYEALLADLRSATSEGHARYDAALKSIRPALDLYSQLALEAPDDPKRLLDAARARLSFARMLERTGRIKASGEQARKTLKQLDRLVNWPGFEAAPLLPLRCDILRILAKDAHSAGNAARAFELAREMQAAAESLPYGLLVRPESETVPRLALATIDLATYAVDAGPGQISEALRESDRAIAACRESLARTPQSPPLIRGVALCLLAKARLLLHEGKWQELQPLLDEAAGLVAGEDSPVRLSSLSLVREISITVTAWTGAVLDLPDGTMAYAASALGQELTNHLRNNGESGREVMVQRARLQYYRSRLDHRFKGQAQAVRNAAQAIWLLCPRQERDPDSLPLALLTAEALHHARGLAAFPETEWNEKREQHLNLLLKQLSKRSNELTPEQLEALSMLK